MEEVVSRFSEIESIQDEIRGHIWAIQGLYARIAGAGRRGPGRPAGRRGPGRRRGRPGRPRGARGPGRPRGSATRRGRGKRAPRGALKAAIHKLLAGGRTVKPGQAVTELQKAGFRTSSKPNVFYNTVYLSLRKDKEIEKTAEGFRLKKR